MIDIVKEKMSVLSSKDKYDILSFAAEAANDNGFINSFVFQRALYVYAALLLVETEEEKEEIRKVLSVNPLAAWDQMIEKGTLQKLIEEYDEELTTLADEGWIWFEEYSSYAHSARGVFDTIEELTGGVVQNAATTFQKTVKETDVSQVLQIADDWGMNRETVKAEPPQKEYSTNEKDSLLK